MNKSLAFLILCFLVTTSLFSQKSDQPVVAIELDSLLVMYAGLENPIQIAHSGVKAEKLIVESDIGIIKMESPGNYLLILDQYQAGKTANFSIYVNKGKDKKEWLGTRNIKILQVPKPTPYFGTKSGGEISLGEIKIENFIRVSISDFLFQGLRYSVLGFKFTYFPKDGTSLSYEANSALFTQEMLRVKASIKRGDKIVFSNIWVKFPGIDSFELSNVIELTVK